MMDENGNLSPEGEEFRTALLQIVRTEVLPLLTRHTTEVIEARVDQAARGLEAQLQPLFDRIGDRLSALEAPPQMSNQAPGSVKAETREDQVSHFTTIGNSLVDTLVAAAEKLIPAWERWSMIRYSHGLTADAVAQLRLSDPIRAATLAQMLNPDPMLNQLPGYTYNILAMGAQAGLRMKQAITGGATSTDGLPGSTSVPGNPLSTPLPASMPIPRPPSSVSMSGRDARKSERQIIKEALAQAKSQLEQAKP